MTKVIKCDRCSRRYRGSGDWNVQMSRGVPVGYLCPDCQTPDESVEAEIHQATLDYDVNPLGRFVARPKGGTE